MSNEPEIVGGPMADVFAWFIQEAQRRSGSPDVDVVECDADGNEVRRIRLVNAKLLRVEVAPAPDSIKLRYDEDIPCGEGFYVPEDV